MRPEQELSIARQVQAFLKAEIGTTGFALLVPDHDMRAVAIITNAPNREELIAVLAGALAKVAEDNARYDDARIPGQVPDA